MKKIIAVLLSVLMLVSMTACGATKDDGKYTIGICQLVTHDALDAATKGFQDGGIGALGAENVEFDLKNAAGGSKT